MKKRLLLAVLVLAAFVAGPMRAAERRPPNVIVILVDDLGYRDLGVQGCADFATPHIDSLAKNGIRCTDAYVTAPVCSPSRAGLLTGRYQNRFGFEFLADRKDVGLATSEKTMADRMKALGYATGCVGKWHLGSEPQFLPMQRGFDEFYGSPGQSNYFTPMLIDSRVGEKAVKRPATDGYYLTDDYATRAADFIQRHARRPFFLYLPHFAVHKPWEASEKYLARFPGIADEKRRAFAAMASALDDAVGQVLETLRRNGLEENTLLFFLTDNGGTGGVGDNTPLRGGKGSTWEGGFRTPFLVQWKGRLPAGKVYAEPIISLDILPTVIAAAGGESDPAWKLDGVNLLPHFEGKTNTPPHDTLYWRFGTQWAIRRGDWKLVQSREGRGGNIQIAKEGPVRLFNLREDLAEKNDLAAAQPDRVVELRRRWDQWNAPLPEPAWKPDPTKE